MKSVHAQLRRRLLFMARLQSPWHEQRDRATSHTRGTRPAEGQRIPPPCPRPPVGLHRRSQSNLQAPESRRKRGNLSTKIVVKTKMSAYLDGRLLWVLTVNLYAEPAVLRRGPPSGFTVALGLMPPQPATNKAASDPPALMIRGCFTIRLQLNPKIRAYPVSRHSHDRSMGRRAKWKLNEICPFFAPPQLF